MSDEGREHIMHTAADVGSRLAIVEHLDKHGWPTVRRSIVDGSLSPDPLGWHSMDGDYLVPDSELLAIHRELHAQDSQDMADRLRCAARVIAGLRMVVLGDGGDPDLAGEHECSLAGCLACGRSN